MKTTSGSGDSAATVISSVTWSELLTCGTIWVMRTVERQGFFEVGEHLGPADAFAHEQGVDEDALVEDFGVFGLADFAVVAGALRD